MMLPVWDSNGYNNIMPPSGLDGSSHGTKKRNHKAWMAALAGIAVIWNLVANRNSLSFQVSKTSQQQEPESPQLKIIKRRLQKFLRENEDISFLTSTTPSAISPHQEALSWLASDLRASSSYYSDTSLLERYLVALFYFSTSGSRWTSQEGFLTSRPVCDWNWQACGSLDERHEQSCRFQGVRCNDIGNVTEIFLNTNNLYGTLPPELKHLSSLEKLSLSGNHFVASSNDVSSECTSKNLILQWVQRGIYTLKRLFVPSSSCTDWTDESESSAISTGPIPLEFGDFEVLHYLSLGNCGLTGTIPSELGHLSRLKGLVLSANHFSGSVPSEIGKLTGLLGLSFSDNKLTGAIPSELGRLERLHYLHLQGNAFTGTLPEEFGGLGQLREMKLD